MFDDGMGFAPMGNPVENPEPVEASAPTEPENNTVEAPTESVEASEASPETAAARRALPRQTEGSVKALYKMSTALQDERVRKAVGFIVGSKSERIPTLMFLLTQKKNRQRVKSLVAACDGLDSGDRLNTVARLTVLFNDDKHAASMMVRVLQTLFPERGFSPVSGVASRDAVNVVEHAGEGVDVTVLSSLLYE